jgi:hypothetical protein
MAVCSDIGGGSRGRSGLSPTGFRRVQDVVLKRHMDLELILEEPNPGIFIDEGIQIGTARRFIRDIQEWDKKVKSNSPPTGTMQGIQKESRILLSLSLDIICMIYTDQKVKE